MAPRRRRSKSSAATQSANHQQHPNTGSGTNSAITSSPSQPTSKSEDSIAGNSPLQHVDNNDPFLSNRTNLVRPQNSLCTEKPLLDDLDSNNEGTTRNNNSNNDGNKKNHLLKCYRESQHKLRQNGTNNNYFTIADVTMQVCMDFVKWAITDIAIQFKRQAFLASENEERLARFKQSNPSSEQKNNSAYDSKKTDSTNIQYGSNLLFSEKGVTVKCFNCLINVSATRYAQHVEKCSGRGGRMSSRAASARMRASAERSEKEAMADNEEPSTRKRRGAMSASANHSSTGLPEGNVISKRRRSSPPTSGRSGVMSPNSAPPRSGSGLPPTGRHRSMS